MSLADEIRARVKQADEARIESRAERAAAVALVHGQRVELVAQLAEIDAALEQSVRAAVEVMTLDELVAFAEVPATDIRGKTLPTGSAVKARSPKARRRPAPKTSPTVEVPPAEPAA